MMQEPSRAASSLAGPGLLQELQRQWRSSLVLRVGVGAIVLIFAVEASHQVGMAASRLNERAAALVQENLLLERQLSKEPWNERLDEAKRHLQAAQSLVWSAPDESLVQASLQDRLRSLAAGAGLDVREVVVVRQVPERPATASPAPAAAPNAPATVPPEDNQQVPLAARLEADGVQVWRLRLTAGFTKTTLVNFLNELSIQEKLLVTEQLRIRTGGSGSTLEIELRALSRPSVAGRSASRQP